MGTLKKVAKHKKMCWTRTFCGQKFLIKSISSKNKFYFSGDEKECTKTPSPSFIFLTCTRKMRQSITCDNGRGIEGKSRAVNKHVWVLSTTSCDIWDKEKHYGWPGALETPASLLLTPSGTSTHRLSATSQMIKTYLKTLQNSSKMANSIDLHWSRSEKKKKFKGLPQR